MSALNRERLDSCGRRRGQEGFLGAGVNDPTAGCRRAVHRGKSIVFIRDCCLALTWKV